MSSSIVIVGTGGHAISVSNVALSCGMSIIAYVDDNKAGGKVLGTPIITKQQCIGAHPAENLVIAIGDNSVRERVYNEYKTELPNSKFPSLIHKSAVIGIKSKIGNDSSDASINVGPNSIVGELCILNTKFINNRS